MSKKGASDLKSIKNNSRDEQKKIKSEGVELSELYVRPQPQSPRVLKNDKQPTFAESQLGLAASQESQTTMTSPGSMSGTNGLQLQVTQRTSSPTKTTETVIKESTDARNATLLRTINPLIDNITSSINYCFQGGKILSKQLPIIQKNIVDSLGRLNGALLRLDDGYIINDKFSALIGMLEELHQAIRDTDIRFENIENVIDLMKRKCKVKGVGNSVVEEPQKTSATLIKESKELSKATTGLGSINKTVSSLTSAIDWCFQEGRIISAELEYEQTGIINGLDRLKNLLNIDGDSVANIEFNTFILKLEKFYRAVPDADTKFKNMKEVIALLKQKCTVGRAGSAEETPVSESKSGTAVSQGHATMIPQKSMIGTRGLQVPQNTSSSNKTIDEIIKESNDNTNAVLLRTILPVLGRIKNSIEYCFQGGKIISENLACVQKFIVRDLKVLNDELPDLYDGSIVNTEFGVTLEQFHGAILRDTHVRFENIENVISLLKRKCKVEKASVDVERVAVSESKSDTAASLGSHAKMTTQKSMIGINEFERDKLSIVAATAQGSKAILAPPKSKVGTNELQTAQSTSSPTKTAETIIKESKDKENADLLRTIKPLVSGLIQSIDWCFKGGRILPAELEDVQKDIVNDLRDLKEKLPHFPDGYITNHEFNTLGDKLEKFRGVIPDANTRFENMENVIKLLKSKCRVEEEGADQKKEGGNVVGSIDLMNGKCRAASHEIDEHNNGAVSVTIMRL